MPLDTAVVGAGVVSDSHLYALQRSPLTNAVAICDLDEERAKRSSEAYDVPYTLDVREWLDDDAIAEGAKLGRSGSRQLRSLLGCVVSRRVACMGS